MLIISYNCVQICISSCTQTFYFLHVLLLVGYIIGKWTSLKTPGTLFPFRLFVDSYPHVVIPRQGFRKTLVEVFKHVHAVFILLTRVDEPMMYYCFLNGITRWSVKFEKYRYIKLYFILNKISHIVMLFNTGALYQHGLTLISAWRE